MNTRRNALWPEGYQPQTASQLAKAAGLKSLKQVTELTGTNPQTLINWHKNKPNLLEVVLLGCKLKAEQNG